MVLGALQFFKNGQELETMKGWGGEAKMRELLTKYGAKPAKKE